MTDKQARTAVGVVISTNAKHPVVHSLAVHASEKLYFYPSFFLLRSTLLCMDDHRNIYLVNTDAMVTNIISRIIWSTRRVRFIAHSFCHIMSYCMTLCSQKVFAFCLACISAHDESDLCVSIIGKH